MSRQSNLSLLTNYYQRILDQFLNHDLYLLADGADTLTNKPVYWTYPDGTKAVMSNFASQQNVLRALVGLSVVTKNDHWKTRRQK